MAKRQGMGQAGALRGMALAATAALGLLTACQHPETATQAAPTQVAPTQALPPKAQPVKERILADHFPQQPSLAPTASVPLAPLGFTAPGALYLGTRNTLVSLDFIDEDRLLFTFRVPGLIHRDLRTGGESSERRIRAVVLKLPQGTVEAEALWTVHDRARYLWPLKDGHFLLRDRNSLLLGDATLALKPYLDFPGSVLWIESDPTQQFLVTNSREPVAVAAKTRAPGGDGSSSTGSMSAQLSGSASSPVASPASSPVSSPATGPATGQTGATTDDDDGTAGAGRPELVVRILRRETGEVMLVSRVRSALHVPINDAGYLENLRGRGKEWMLSLSYFTGGSRMLGSVDTACDPDDEFISQNEILVTGCSSEGANRLVAMTTEGKTLWIAQAPSTQVWPYSTMAPNGSRVAWITLDASHGVSMFAPLDGDDVKEQSVTVFDAATGDVAFVSPLSPILDAGGNVALSTSGRRVALLNAGAIEVFDLPAAPEVPGR